MMISRTLREVQICFKNDSKILNYIFSRRKILKKIFFRGEFKIVVSVI